MSFLNRYRQNGYLLFATALLLTILVYWPGLSGGWLFDDYPNIINNRGIQPAKINLASLVSAALSSPASDLRRPLSSLSFVANFAINGLNPWGWKVTNLLIHLLNGVLVFVLSRMLMLRVGTHSNGALHQRASTAAACIAGAWMILPINLSAVLYIVQREESLANLFVLLGLIGYIAGRTSMLAKGVPSPYQALSWRGFGLCCLSIVVPTLVGALAKETAVLLPLYALCAEWALFTRPALKNQCVENQHALPLFDWRIAALFFLTLVLPAVIGLIYLLPGILKLTIWATRDFTLETRLMTEARVVLSYLAWTVFPTPQALSFYHDQYHVSSGWLHPWTTLISALTLLALVGLGIRMRQRFPLVALGIAWFLGCHLLTATVIPLELVYEHRNYFASFGIMLIIIPLLVAPGGRKPSARADATQPVSTLPLAMPRYVLFGGLVVCWTALTLATSYAWGDPLRQASDFAARAPDSPRALYELGRTYIIYSNYDPNSGYRKLAYDVLERAASLPESSILPQQALIFMNARMHVPVKDSWWDSMIAKLKARKPTIQDESSLQELSTCQISGECDLPKQRMLDAYLAALSHPTPTARLLNMYGTYAWEALGDRTLGVRMLEEAVAANPKEPAYRVTLVRMLTDMGRLEEARQALKDLEPLNLAGNMDEGIAALNARIAAKEKESRE
nr:hypothetical protein [Dyella sp. ASV24]